MKNILLFITANLAIAAAPCLAVVPAPDGGYAGHTTAEGTDALFNLAGGLNNTAVGYRALYNDTAGGNNTAIGDSALQLNTTGRFNTATGGRALQANTAGGNNTAIGYQTLLANTGGGWNTATGYFALQANTTGNYNTATGHVALLLNTTGSLNTAIGSLTLHENTTGDSNTAIGNAALHENTTGSRNIGVGPSAGFKLTTGDDNIDIGSNDGFAGEAATIRIGACGTQTDAYMAGIFGVMVPNGTPVLIDSNCHLGTTTSSSRFKEAIKPMEGSSAAIFSLKSVNFRYKKEIDPAGVTQFGLVAEDVEKINPNLVVHDNNGKPYTVRYEAVNAMLLNEFLKAHRQIEEQEATIAELKSGLKALAATVEKQAAQIQKVSERVVVDRVPPTFATNN